MVVRLIPATRRGSKGRHSSVQPAVRGTGWVGVPANDPPGRRASFTSGLVAKGKIGSASPRSSDSKPQAPGEVRDSELKPTIGDSRAFALRPRWSAWRDPLWSRAGAEIKRAANGPDPAWENLPKKPAPNSGNQRLLGATGR